MSYLDWGKLDLAGALITSMVNRSPLFLVGHSYGGQALGLTPNHQKVTAMYCFGTGAGWHGYMPFKENQSPSYLEYRLSANGCCHRLFTMEQLQLWS